jgi:hypothetical protein
VRRQKNETSPRDTVILGVLVEIHAVADCIFVPRVLVRAIKESIVRRGDERV